MRKSLKGRFRVWDLGTDQYNNSDLVYNWDKIDEIVGGADGSTGQSSSTSYPQGYDSTWLGSTSTVSASPHYPGADYGSINQAIGARTLYSVVAGLNYNDVPLGTVVAWWRPVADSTGRNAALNVPDGWAICDGRTIASADHSFGTNTPITLPDLVNKTVVGSTTTQAANATGANSYVIDPAQAAKPLDGPSYAPGLGYDSGKETGIKSGSNAIRNLSHVHEAGTALLIPAHSHEITNHYHPVGSHTHKLAPHVHDMWHQHAIPNHVHGGSVAVQADTGAPVGFDKTISAGGSSIRVVRIPDSAPKRNDDWLVPTAAHVHNIRANQHTGGRASGEPISYFQNDNGYLYPYHGMAVNFGNYPGDPAVGNLAFSSLPLFLTETGASNNSGTADKFVSAPRAAKRLLFTGTGTDVSTMGGPQFYVDGEVPASDFNATQGSDVFWAGKASSSNSVASSAWTGTTLDSDKVSGQTATWGPTITGATGPNSVPSLTCGTSGPSAGPVHISQVNPRNDYVGLLYIMKVKVSTNII